MVENDLKELGLSQNEIRIYLFLLENGVSSAPQIASGTKIALTNSYHILNKLKLEGLLIEQKVGKRSRYAASDPEVLLRSVESRRASIQKLLPDLRALYGSQKNKPKIRFFEGVGGLENIFEETLEAEEKILGIASTANLFKKMPNYFPGYRKRLKERGVFFYDILTSDSATEASERAKNELGAYYTFRILPDSYENIVTDILIWQNKIALLTIDEPLFGTIVEDAHLAKTFRMIFDITWKTARVPANQNEN